MSGKTAVAAKAASGNDAEEDVERFTSFSPLYGVASDGKGRGSARRRRR
jgi:hypothetical protein